MIRPLIKVSRGHWKSRDGLWEFVRDPTGSGFPGGWGFGSWLVFRTDSDHGEAEYVEGEQHFASLADAVSAVEDHVARERAEEEGGD